MAKKTGGLGKGLSALIGETVEETQTESTPTQPQELAIEDVHRNPSWPAQ